MVKKFHINPDGRVMECGAKIKCDFADSPHFDDFSSASNYAELMAMKSWKESKSETNERKPREKYPQRKRELNFVAVLTSIMRIVRQRFIPKLTKLFVPVNLLSFFTPLQETPMAGL